MNRYQVYGQCLESDLAFPELAPTAGPAHWALTTVAGAAAPPADALWLGDDSVQGDVRVRLHQAEATFWLDFDDTGAFEVSVDGRALRWHRPGAGPELDELARIDVLGRVLALALHAEGRLCLHGSGVCTGGAALGFLAPKFHGKSTLALALVRAGARLLTDDTLVVATGAVPHALPGVHAMRLWGDSAARLLDDGVGTALADGDKLCLRDLPAARRMQCSAPLAAVYLLTPTHAGDNRPAAVRTPLPPTAAALALVGHGKLSPLLGRAQATLALRRAVDVALSVPVYTLSVVRDFARLDEVVDQLLRWHGGPPATSAPAMSALATPHAATPHGAPSLPHGAPSLADAR